jgi:hypothetical protein
MDDLLLMTDFGPMSLSSLNQDVDSPLAVRMRESPLGLGYHVLHPREGQWYDLDLMGMSKEQFELLATSNVIAYLF